MFLTGYSGSSGSPLFLTAGRDARPGYFIWMPYYFIVSEAGNMKVVIIDGEMAGKEFILTKPVNRIGRAKDLEICIPVDKTISRRHAVIRKSMGQFILEDLESVNGTFLLAEEDDPEAKDESIDKIILINGRKFIVGETVMQFMGPKVHVDVLTKPDGSKLAVCDIPDIKIKKTPPPEFHGEVISEEPKKTAGETEDKASEEPDKHHYTRLRLKPRSKRSYYNIQNTVVMTLVLLIVAMMVMASLKAITSFKPESKPSPLHRAVATGNTKVVELLLWWKHDVNALDAYKNTPLHTSVELNQPKMTELLIRNGANLNPQNEDGNTPLHLAANEGNYPAALLLVQYGAKMEILNAQGHTPLDAALRSHTESIVELLKNSHKVARKKIETNKDNSR